MLEIFVTGSVLYWRKRMSLSILQILYPVWFPCHLCVVSIQQSATHYEEGNSTCLYL